MGVAQLCATAAVNKGSFYHFFPSKKALLLEVVDNAWDETGLLRQWESRVPDRPLEQVGIFLEELFAFHYADREATGRVRGSMVANIGVELAPSDPQVAERLAALLRREEAIFESVLRAALAQGELAMGNPPATAQTVVACLHGLLVTARVKDDLSVIPTAESALLRLMGADGRPS